MRKLALVAIAACTAVAGGAAWAQSRWVHPDGRSAYVLPPGMVVDEAVAGDPKVFLSYSRRDGTKVAECIAGINPVQSVEKSQWARLMATYNADPEREMRRATAETGDTFNRFLGSRPFTSPGGYEGYFIWFDRTLKTKGYPEQVIRSATHTDAVGRTVVLCVTVKGQTFQAADVDAIHRFTVTIRRP